MRLFSKFLDLLFPPKCAFCHALLKSGEEYGVCRKCEKSLPYTSGSDIKQKIPLISECCAPLYYEGSVRQSLLRYKFGQCTGYADIYGDLVSECICENLGGRFDIVSWVPLSRARKRKRGYDQAYLIAASVGRHLDMPVVPTLKKVKDVKAQSSTGNAEKRRANISGAYGVIDVQSVAGRNILLVDDIITTGSTLSESARTLQMAGAGEITAAAVARHRD